MQINGGAEEARTPDLQSAIYIRRNPLFSSLLAIAWSHLKNPFKKDNSFVWCFLLFSFVRCTKKAQRKGRSLRISRWLWRTSYRERFNNYTYKSIVGTIFRNWRLRVESEHNEQNQRQIPNNADCVDWGKSPQIQIGYREGGSVSDDPPPISE